MTNLTFSRPLEELSDDEVGFLRENRPIEYISFLIERGYTNGFFPSFQLVLYDKKDFGNKGSMRKIAAEILNGKTENEYPKFKLKKLSNTSLSHINSLRKSK